MQPGGGRRKYLAQSMRASLKVSVLPSETALSDVQGLGVPTCSLLTHKCKCALHPRSRIPMPGWDGDSKFKASFLEKGDYCSLSLSESSIFDFRFFFSLFPLSVPQFRTPSSRARAYIEQEVHVRYDTPITE